MVGYMYGCEETVKNTTLCQVNAYNAVYVHFMVVVDSMIPIYSSQTLMGGEQAQMEEGIGHNFEPK